MTTNKKPFSARQKMINLLYVVLIAMLALNVSSDVLRGFAIIDDSLDITLREQKQRNDSLYSRIATFASNHAVKAAPYKLKADSLRMLSSAVYRKVQDLKEEIVIMADGADGTIDNLQNCDDTEAAAQVMLSPILGYGAEFIYTLRGYLLYVNHMGICGNGLIDYNDNWLSKSFEAIPASAALALLSKVELDAALMETDVLNKLYSDIDKGDLRVNKIDAVVIPESQFVLQNRPYNAQVVLAAMDTTNRPSFFQMNGKKQIISELKDGKFQAICPTIGKQTFSGEMVALDNDNREWRKQFSSSYTVITPSATIAPELTMVLYAGIENPLSVSAPGVDPATIRMVTTTGSVVANVNGKFSINPPPSSIGQTVHLSVFSDNQLLDSHAFRVRSLPKPSPYISYINKEKQRSRFWGGKIKRNILLQAKGIEAAIDDGILDIPYKVLSFEMVLFDRMGNAVPEASNGQFFSKRQRLMIKQMGRNQRFYISKILVSDPNDKQITINSSMEVIVE